MTLNALQNKLGPNRNVLLIVSGGIAAYRALEVARTLRRDGVSVTPVMTPAAQAFITPLSLEVLCGQPVHQELFSPNQESQIGHIALARAADLVLVCPATANLLARMANGFADDLATTLLLATTAPILVAPAMNVRMWDHPATQKNLETLRLRGVNFIGPEAGAMACGEEGVGRLAEPSDIAAEVRRLLNARRELQGRRVLVTAGPTVEPLDPVRFISNRSSGRQGYAIAEALARHGAEVTLVSGPVSLPAPFGVERINVRTAREMHEACLRVLPVDAAICVAAVSDWRAKAASSEKIKKNGQPPVLELEENPDILASLCHVPQRPSLVIGFAAETERPLEHGRAKRLRKGCEWLLVNDVSEGRIFDATHNQVWFLAEETEENWPEMSKAALAEELTQRVISFFSSRPLSPSPPLNP